MSTLASTPEKIPVQVFAEAHEFCVASRALNSPLHRNPLLSYSHLSGPCITGIADAAKCARADPNCPDRKERKQCRFLNVPMASKTMRTSMNY